MISLYAKGLTTGEIGAHLDEIYGIGVSRETISKITDAVVTDMTAWQNRTPRRGLPGAGFDAIVVKVRDAQVANRPVYVAIGVDLAGERDVGGLWLGPAGGEGAKQWATMLTELRNRGLADALIVCCDGNGGPARVDPRHLARRDSPDLRRAHGPQQPPLCVQEALGPDHQSHARDLCTAPTVGAAEARFAEFSADWADTYPAMIQSWQNSWDEFVPFLAFPAELRRVVYTTNAIESLNARFRRAVRHRGHSPQRTGRDENPLPCRHHQTQQRRQPRRQDQQLEHHPQHTHRPLRRPHRRPHPMNTITPGYTKNLTVPQAPRTPQACGEAC